METPEEVTTNQTDCEKRKGFFEKLAAHAGEKVALGIQALLGNRMSHGQLQRKLHEAIASNERDDTWVWVIDVYDDEVIFGRELATGRSGSSPVSTTSVRMRVMIPSSKTPWKFSRSYPTNR